jgi:Flp pilus assembly protein TadG
MTAEQTRASATVASTARWLPAGRGETSWRDAARGPATSLGRRLLAQGRRRLGRWSGPALGQAGERANAALELALLLPVLVVILVGVIDFGRAYYAYVTVASAAHEAAGYSTRYPGAAPSREALATVVAGESGGFVKLMATAPSGGGGGGGGPTSTPSGNTTLTGPEIRGTGTEQVAQVTLTYSFKPIVPVPLTGPIEIRAVANAPLGNSTPMPTSTSGPSPTATAATPTPTVAPTGTATATASPTPTQCVVPSLVGVPINGNAARDLWTAAGFSAANFTKDENNGTVQSQSLPAGSMQPCATAAITVHNHS